MRTQRLIAGVDLRRIRHAEAPVGHAGGHVIVNAGDIVAQIIVQAVILRP